jgi:hypothetical protein
MRDHATYVKQKHPMALLSYDDFVLDGGSLGLGGMDVTVLAGHGARDEFTMH